MFKRKLTMEEKPLFIIPLLVLILPFLLRSNWMDAIIRVTPLGAAKENAKRTHCAGNLRAIALSMRQYLADYESKYPLAAWSGTRTVTLASPVGWADALLLRATNSGASVGSSIYQCSGETRPPRVNPAQSGYTDFWINGNISGRRQSTLASATTTLLAGEGSDGTDVTDATYSKTSLPPNWLTDRSKPPWRHLGGANYLHADGHVAWLKASEISTAPGQPHTFAIK
jgi:prepilin-type processing-associated H-X9-DG protein